MPNKYVNKVVIGKETKLDLTADTVTPDKLAKGITAHDKSGAPITGTSTKDADTSDATAALEFPLHINPFVKKRQRKAGAKATDKVRILVRIRTPQPMIDMGYKKLKPRIAAQISQQVHQRH